MAHTIDNKWYMYMYFVFKDHSEVCVVFPEHMESQVARVQPAGVLKNQSVSPLLSAYNMFMGGVDRTAA